MDERRRRPSRSSFPLPRRRCPGLAQAVRSRVPAVLGHPASPCLLLVLHGNSVIVPPSTLQRPTRASGWGLPRATVRGAESVEGVPAGRTSIEDAAVRGMSVGGRTVGVAMVEGASVEGASVGVATAGGPPVGVATVGRESGKSSIRAAVESATGGGASSKDAPAGAAKRGSAPVGRASVGGEAA